jgi:tRNA A37 methylthiotransferase MiaB
MNVSDSEIVASVLNANDYDLTDTHEDADAILVNTCAIRDGAEAKIWARLRQLKAVKRDREIEWKRASRKGESDARPAPVVGILGCMGERLKEKLLEADGLADLVAGPDAYRDLPRLIDAARGDDGGDLGAAINTQLSLEETYADIAPVRRPNAGPSAFVSIMRGCNNMCAFCIVPFTRGRERSRPVGSILNEIRRLSDEGVKEVTLLGQNVNSFADMSMSSGSDSSGDVGSTIGITGNQGNHGSDPFERYYAPGFSSVYKPKRDGAVRFAELLDAVADVDPEMRVRFTSPHPKDFPDEVLRVIAERPNVTKQLHMPAQSGSSSVLERMRRGYTREAYLDLVARARRDIPGVALSSDFISGFCGETEEEHADTVSLMHLVGYEKAFMFAYSMREKTAAARHLNDDVPEHVKKRRLAEVIDAQRKGAEAANALEVGRVHCVLVEGRSKRSDERMSGRTCTNKRVIVDGVDTTAEYDVTHGSQHGSPTVTMNSGDYVAVRIDRAGANTLYGTPLGRTELGRFHRIHGGSFA